MSRSQPGGYRPNPTPIAVRDASKSTLRKLLDRLKKIQNLEQRILLRKELDDYLGLLQDNVIKVYHAGDRPSTEQLLSLEQELFEAVDALEKGESIRAVSLLEKALEHKEW